MFMQFKSKKKSLKPQKAWFLGFGLVTSLFRFSSLNFPPSFPAICAGKRGRKLSE